MGQRNYLVTLLIALLASCGTGQEEKYQSLQKKVIENYAELVYQSYSKAYSDAQILQSRIDNLLESPSEESMRQAKQAWLDARFSYGKTEAFRFYGGPIDDEDGPEGQLNAWPLDEAYIDYVEGAIENNSIINQVKQYPQINAELIASLNEKGSETNVSSGYHAIEFLLWGQDFSDGPGAGERPISDFMISQSDAAEIIKRRRTYLKEVTALLLSDLEYLVEEWEAGQENYRSTFVAEPESSLEKILAGLGKLSKGELAGERMFVAFDLRSKEDEHSCFSDNTHNDIISNALGIRNVFHGTLRNANNELDGPGLYELIAMKDEQLAKEIDQKLKESVKACKQIQPPFDQEFLNKEGRERIATAINHLRDQGDLFAEAAKLLGFQLDPSAV